MTKDADEIMNDEKVKISKEADFLNK